MLLLFSYQQDYPQEQLDEGMKWVKGRDDDWEEWKKGDCCGCGQI